MHPLQTLAKLLLAEIGLFSRFVLRRPLYAYQQPVARAIIDSILHQRGLEFVVIFPRQSGKNEVQSHLQAYLLFLFQRIAGAQIVIASPTFRPQAINAMMRLETQLANDWMSDLWSRVQGYMVRLGQAAALFFSAEPTANTVGATASIALFVDEAQDVLEDVWGKKFEPMTASTAATISYWGTVWTKSTMLAKNRRRLEVLEQKDGIKRVFVVQPEQVVAENPRYQVFIDRMVEKYGRQHPFVKTQIFNEEIDAEGGMFPPARRALMQGTHSRLEAPVAGELYAFAVDVAGEDESITAIGADGGAAALANPKRDSTILRIARVVATQRPPRYDTVHVLEWIGDRHSRIHDQIAALIKVWRPVYIVTDATGVGAGLSSLLAAQFGDRVIPFTFTGSSKSVLGWDLLAMADTGRCLMYAPNNDDITRTWAEQLEHCQYEIIPGPARLMRWGVQDGTRNLATGLTVHDDHLITAALLSVLDEQPWIVPTGPTHIVRAADPLDTMKGY